MLSGGGSALIRQRTTDDCTICCIAMALGLSYEEVLAAGLETDSYRAGQGTRNEWKILTALGYADEEAKAGAALGAFIHRTCPFALAPDFFRTFAWGRRALMSLPSRNGFPGYHMIFWTGGKVLDPSPLLTYTAWEELGPREMILFRETR